MSFCERAKQNGESKNKSPKNFSETFFIFCRFYAYEIVGTSDKIVFCFKTSGAPGVWFFFFDAHLVFVACEFHVSFQSRNKTQLTAAKKMPRYCLGVSGLLSSIDHHMARNKLDKTCANGN